MATIYKVLGQSLPASTSATLYTVPAATDTVVSTINACNTSASVEATIDIAIRVAGATLADSQYLVKGLSLAASTTFTYTAGITLDATDVITVVSSTSNVAFSAFGSEIS